MMNVMKGKLVDITRDNSICVIEIEVDKEKTIICYAETNPFINSIDNAFKDEWHNEVIEFELDSNRIMKWFIPSS